MTPSPTDTPLLPTGYWARWNDLSGLFTIYQDRAIIASTQSAQIAEQIVAALSALVRPAAGEGVDEGLQALDDVFRYNSIPMSDVNRKLHDRLKTALSRHPEPPKLADKDAEPTAEAREFQARYDKLWADESADWPPEMDKLVRDAIARGKDALLYRQTLVNVRELLRVSGMGGQQWCTDAARKINEALGE